MPQQSPASSSKPASDITETTEQPQLQQTSTVAQPGTKDPTSFVLPNPINYFFPIYWLTILIWRKITDTFPSFSRQRERAELILDGIEYGEAPRIRDGKVLYFVDMYIGVLYSLDLESRRIVNTRTLAGHAPKISGLGWLPAPDSRLLVVSMENFKLLAVNVQEDDAAETSMCEFADLSNFARKYINDMCVDTAHGVAFVGNMGFDLSKIWTMRATTLACVKLDGSSSNDQLQQQQEDRVKPVARDLLFPNGMVVTPDGRMLIVAETLRGTLTAFDLPPAHEQGRQVTLSNRRTWAYVGLPIDGICLDSAGRVWAGVPCIGMMRALGGAVRVKEGGHIDAMVGFGANGLTTGVIACNLYTTAQGEHRLVMLTAKTTMEEEIKTYYKRQNSALYTIKVDCGPALRAGDDTYHAGYC